MRSKGQKIDKTIAAYVIQNLVARSVYEFEIFFCSELSRFTLGEAYIMRLLLMISFPRSKYSVFIHMMES